MKGMFASNLGVLLFKVGDLKLKTYFCNPIFDSVPYNSSSCLRERFNPPFAREEINMVFVSGCQQQMAAAFWHLAVAVDASV
jgi:hypothetical protein